MCDFQNSSRNRNGPETTEDKESLPDKTVPPKKSYYYDDATGYEIYDDESEENEEDS